MNCVTSHPQSCLRDYPYEDSARREFTCQLYSLQRFHTGQWTGEWLVTTRCANWEVFGKVQEALAKDPDFAKVLARARELGELKGRNIAVGIDL